MLILLLLSIEVNISPNPIEGRVGEKIPYSVMIMNDEGISITGRLEFNVIPTDLGRITGNTFIPSKKGKGVLKCKVTMNGKIFTGYSYIRIIEEKRAKLIPPSANIEVGEEIQFKVSDGKYLNWKIIPEEIGEIRDGLFIAKNPGKGRIVAILDNGTILSAFVRVKGKQYPLDIVPKFNKVKIGDKIQFSIKEKLGVTWEVEPEDIGTIDNNGLFYAKSPGRGIVIARVKEGTTERIGRAIIIASGKLKIRIIPEKITIGPGESARFQLKPDPGISIRNIPVRWNIIPKQCGIIRKDGTFVAGKFPINGRVVAILPERFGGGVASSRISIVPENGRILTVIPRFKELKVGEEFFFSIPQDVPVHWKVVPEDLGFITPAGKFTPNRSGSGVIIAEPMENINAKPGRALVIVGINENVTLFLPNEIIERFSLPIRINTNLKNYTVTWHVIPGWAGRVTSNGTFYANPLPEGKERQPVTIYAIFHKGRQILGWGSIRVTIVKRS